MWWDVRLQPSFGTLEVRIMDAQTRVEDSAVLAALVQCLVRLAATSEPGAPGAIDAPEVVAENRFIAVRDGMRAALIDPPAWRRRPVGDRLARAARRVRAARPGAGMRGRAGATCRRWPSRRAPTRQRAMAERAGIDGLVEALSQEFLPVPPSGAHTRRV